MKYLKLLFISVCIMLNFAGYSKSYSAMCTMDGKTYENTLVDFGYMNLGTDDDPEYVWTIHGVIGDEVVHLFFFSKNALWVFQSQHPFLKNSDLALVKDIYALCPAGKNQDFVQIGTYGCNYDGDFTPQYMLLTIYSPQGLPQCNYWINYTPTIKEEIYNAIKDAIDYLGIPRAKLP